MLRQTIGTLVRQMHDMSFPSTGPLLPGFRGTDAEAEASSTASLAVMAAQAAAHAISATTFGFIDGSNKKFDFAASADSTGSGSALGNSVEFDQQATPGPDFTTFDYFPGKSPKHMFDYMQVADTEAAADCEFDAFGQLELPSRPHNNTSQRTSCV